MGVILEIPIEIVGEGDTCRIPAASLRALATVAIEHAGIVAEDAALLADALVMADARGMHSHGVLRLPVYLGRIRAGGFSSTPHFEILRETPGTALVDGGNYLGAVLTSRAMDLAIAKARETGIGAVGVRDSNHNGEGAPYAMRAIDAGMIGIATTNGSPIMPAWGARAPALTGPLPITFGIPAGAFPPILLDMSLGMSSRGKILYHAERKLPLPPGWLVDAEGRPTTDAEWVRNGGWILPIGGHKGWGLILMAEILSGILTGGAVGREMVNLYDELHAPQRTGHFVMPIDIEAFVGLDRFRERIEAYIALMKASERAEGVAEILMPGEIEHRNRLRQERDGIVLGKAVIEEVLAAARETGVAATAHWTEVRA